MAERKRKAEGQDPAAEDDDTLECGMVTLDEPEDESYHIPCVLDEVLEEGELAKVIAGREEELDRCEEFELWEPMPAEEIPSDMKKLPIRWVDDRRGEECRGRIVAKDLKAHDPYRDDLYAP